MECWDIPIFTDLSKLGGSTGAGVFCTELGLELLFRLNDDCRVFQAEIFTILKAIQGPLRIRNLTWMIFIDNPAALRTIASVCCKSWLICEGKELLRTFGPDRIRLCWVPQHILPGASASYAPTPVGYTNRWQLFLDLVLPTSSSPISADTRVAVALSFIRMT